MQANNVSGIVFAYGQDSHSLPVIMKRLQAITIRRSRGTFNKMSMINKMKAMKAAKKRTEGSSIPDSGLEGELAGPGCIVIPNLLHLMQHHLLTALFS